jgi:hypothetical protein
LPNNRGLFHKYTTVHDLQESSRWNDGCTVKISAQSDTRLENFDIPSYDGITLYSESAPDIENVWIGSLNISGTTDQLTVSGISITDTITLGSNGEYIVFYNCCLLGQVVAVASGIPTDLELVRSFEKCRISSDITINGDAVCEYGFYDCWSYVKADGTWPTITINNPNATLILDGTTALKTNIVVLEAAKFEMNGVSINSLSVAGHGDVVLKTGTVCDSDDETTLRPIYLQNSGKYTLGTVVHSRTNSVYGPQFQTSGIGSLQVRENDVRAGYTPRISDDGTNRPLGPGGNTIKDQLNGISDAIVALMGAQAGIADGGISDDETKINFYPDTVNKGDQYALFQLPLSLFGVFKGDESSITLNTDNSFSVLLESGPVFDALNTRVPKETGKVLSDNNYSTGDMNKLTSLATINTITQANGLALSEGVLSFTPQRGRVNLSTSCDGATLIFPGTYTNSFYACVYLNGLKLCSGTNYTITDTTLTLSTTPPVAGSILEVELF